VTIIMLMANHRNLIQVLMEMRTAINQKAVLLEVTKQIVLKVIQIKIVTVLAIFIKPRRSRMLLIIQISSLRKRNLNFL
jgi:hypothetical protein